MPFSSFLNALIFQAPFSSKTVAMAALAVEMLPPFPPTGPEPKILQS